jgi:hypothetical protein
MDQWTSLNERVQKKLSQIKYFAALLQECTSNRPFISLLERNQLFELLSELRHSLTEENGQQTTAELDTNKVTKDTKTEVSTKSNQLSNEIELYAQLQKLAEFKHSTGPKG